MDVAGRTGLLLLGGARPEVQPHNTPVCAGFLDPPAESELPPKNVVGTPTSRETLHIKGQGGRVGGEESRGAR
jgi:hypothetical protein